MCQWLQMNRKGSPHKRRLGFFKLVYVTPAFCCLLSLSLYLFLTSLYLYIYSLYITFLSTHLSFPCPCNYLVLFLSVHLFLSFCTMLSDFIAAMIYSINSKLCRYIKHYFSYPRFPFPSLCLFQSISLSQSSRPASCHIFKLSTAVAG
jgi:hypothetical protein